MGLPENPRQRIGPIEHDPDPDVPNRRIEKPKKFRDALRKLETADAELASSIKDLIAGYFEHHLDPERDLKSDKLRQALAENESLSSLLTRMAEIAVDREPNLVQGLESQTRSVDQLTEAMLDRVFSFALSVNLEPEREPQRRHVQAVLDKTRQLLSREQND